MCFCDFNRTIIDVFRQRSVLTFYHSSFHLLANPYLEYIRIKQISIFILLGFSPIGLFSIGVSSIGLFSVHRYTKLITENKTTN